MSVAQRLVRKLCNECKKKEAVSKDIFPQHFEIPKTLITHYTAIGCNSCYHTGYASRKAIYEIIPITKILVSHIKNNDLEIDDYIDKNNISTLKNNAINLVQQGITSVDEVYALLTH